MYILWPISLFIIDVSKCSKTFGFTIFRYLKLSNFDVSFFKYRSTSTGTAVCDFVPDKMESQNMVPRQTYTEARLAPGSTVQVY